MERKLRNIQILPSMPHPSHSPEMGYVELCHSLFPSLDPQGSRWSGEVLSEMGLGLLCGSFFSHTEMINRKFNNGGYTSWSL